MRWRGSFLREEILLRALLLVCIAVLLLGFVLAISAWPFGLAVEVLLWLGTLTKRLVCLLLGFPQWYAGHCVEYEGFTVAGLWRVFRGGRKRGDAK